AVGKVLNPKTFIMGIRDMATDAEVGMPLIPEGEAGRLAGLASRPNGAARAAPRLGTGAVLRRAGGLRGGGGRAARGDRGPLLGRLRGRLRRAQPQGGACLRVLPRPRRG